MLFHVDDVLRGGEEEFRCDVGIESCGDLPGEDAAGVIVDYRVQVGATRVEKADHGRVNVPDLVGARGSNPHLGAGGMDALPWTPPLAIADQPVPSGHRSQDHAQPLSQDSQGPGVTCRYSSEVTSS